MLIKKEYTTITKSNAVSNQNLEIEEGSYILFFLLSLILYCHIVKFSKLFSANRKRERLRLEQF